ncbi:hypothetical protein, partial [Streptococcus pneumoniae]|uniref:hypothetical protein n=1 Tax=Streptococcus pneumoniae TaxID=1313 RepID=UPI0038CD64DB
GINAKPILVGIFKVLDLCHIALSIRVKDNHLDKLMKAPIPKAPLSPLARETIDSALTSCR